MKIGILTLPLHNNIGGLLQAYAMQSYLKKIGHEAVLINRQAPKISISSLDDLKMEILKRVFKNKFSTKKEKELIGKNTLYFREKYIVPATPVIHTHDELQKNISAQGFDALVVGSDQVWRLEYSKSLYKNFFLDFVKNPAIVKLSYAASFGLDAWKHDAKITKTIAGLLQQFDHISVREDTGVEICKKEFDVEARHHIDPTLLLKADEYRALIEKEAEPPIPGKVFAYILDMNPLKKEAISQAANYCMAGTYVLNTKLKYQDKQLQNRIFPRVTQWLKGFADAQFVVTDSFHGCVFSVIFNKPFIAIGNKHRGLTRFNSLFRQFGLEDRLVLSQEDLREDLFSTPINYDRVNEVLERERKKSYIYLTMALGTKK